MGCGRSAATVLSAVALGACGAANADEAASTGAQATTAREQIHRCRTHQLKIRLTAIPGGLGHVGYVIRFHNRGSTCALRGYPGVDGVAHGRAVVHARRTRHGYLGGLHARRLPTVHLRAGSTASALLEGLGVTRSWPVAGAALLDAWLGGPELSPGRSGPS